MKPRVLQIWVISMLCMWQVGECVDFTREVGANGTAVVVRAVELVEGAGIFNDDSGLLRRLALVESNDGGSYVAGTGGIWKISTFVFSELQSKNFNASRYYSSINNIFSIDWNTVVYADLDKPLYSALASRLVIAHAETAGSTVIPADVSVQYNTWVFYFHDNQAPITLQQFTTVISGISTKCTSGQRDVIILIDSSSAVSSLVFAEMKSFAASLVPHFHVSSNSTRFAVVQFAGQQQDVLELSEGVTEVNVTASINGLAQLKSEPVQTGIAVAHAVRLFDVVNGGRPTSGGVVQVLVIITERPSIDNATIPIQNAIADEIQIIAIGVGNSIAVNDLTSLASDPSNVFYSNVVSSLSVLASPVQTSICRAPITTAGNTSISGTLGPSEIQNFRITVLAQGTELRVSCNPASMTAYFSTSVTNPTSAIYDNRMVVNLPNIMFLYDYTPPNGSLTNGQLSLYCGLECTATTNCSYLFLIGTEPEPATTTAAAVVAVTVAPSSLTDAEIAGIVIACIIFLCGIIIAIAYYYFARNDNPDKPAKKVEVTSAPTSVRNDAPERFTSSVTGALDTPPAEKREITNNGVNTAPEVEAFFTPSAQLPDEESIVRERLRVAVANDDTSAVVSALKDFRRLNLDDRDGHVILAERLISLQNCKEGISYAIAERNVHYLQRAIFDVKQKQHQNELKEEVKSAEILLKELGKIQSLTSKLKAAMDNGDVEAVERLTFELRSLSGCEPWMVDRMLDIYRCKEDLEQSMRTRDIDLVSRTLNIVDERGYEPELAVEVKQAKRMRKELEYLEKVRREVLNLNQGRVSEIRSYSSPPPGVYAVMKAVYLILGYDTAYLQKWTTIQSLMGKSGKEGLRRRIKEIDPRTVNLEKAQTAFSIIEQFDLAAVQELSLGLSLFYSFVRSVIDEVEKLHTGVLNAPSPFEYLRAAAPSRPNWGALGISR